MFETGSGNRNEILFENLFRLTVMHAGMLKLFIWNARELSIDQGVCEIIIIENNIISEGN